MGVKVSKAVLEAVKTIVDEGEDLTLFTPSDSITIPSEDYYFSFVEDVEEEMGNLRELFTSVTNEQVETIAKNDKALVDFENKLQIAETTIDVLTDTVNSRNEEIVGFADVKEELQGRVNVLEKELDEHENMGLIDRIKFLFSIRLF